MTDAARKAKRRSQSSVQGEDVNGGASLVADKLVKDLDFL